MRVISLFAAAKLTYTLCVNFSLQQYINDKIKAAGTTRNAAKLLGISEMQVSRLGIGQDPKLSTFIRILESIGGDIARALPEWEPPAPDARSLPTMWVEGQVAAGAVSMHGENRYQVVGTDQTWRDTIYWKMTRGPVIMIEVFGESMVPEYLPGDLLACRQPVFPDQIPDKTPCIFRQGDEMTFKLLRWARGDIPVGEAINRDHDLVIFDANEELHITHVVLGKLSRGAAVTRGHRDRGKW